MLLPIEYTTWTYPTYPLYPYHIYQDTKKNPCFVCPHMVNSHYKLGPPPHLPWRWRNQDQTSTSLPDLSSNLVSKHLQTLQWDSTSETTQIGDWSMTHGENRRENQVGFLRTRINNFIVMVKSPSNNVTRQWYSWLQQTTRFMRGSCWLRLAKKKHVFSWVI